MRKLSLLLLAGLLAGTLSSCAGYVNEVAFHPGAGEWTGLGGGVLCYQVERHYHAYDPCCVKGKIDMRFGQPVVCCVPTVDPCAKHAAGSVSASSSSRSMERGYPGK